MTLVKELGIRLVFSLLLVPSNFGEERLVLDLNKFNSTMLDMSCRYEGEQTNLKFMIFKDRRKCLNTNDSTCKQLRRYEYYCQVYCKEMTDPNIVSFRVKLNGSCKDKYPIKCSVSGSMLQPAIFNLTAMSDPPVISINKGLRIQTGLDPVQIVCKVANQCYQNKIYVEMKNGYLSALNISHANYGSRFNATAETTAIFRSPGNYIIICNESGKDNYSTRLPVDVYDKGSKVINGVTIIEIFFKSTIGIKLVTISYSLELSGGLQPSPGPNGIKVLEFGKKGQFLTLKGEPDSCLSDILLCDKGITFSTEIQFGTFEENAVFIDSGGGNPKSYGLVVKYTLSALVFSVSTKTNVWTVTVPIGEVPRDHWMKMDISWKVDIGLKIFFNNSLVAESFTRDVTATKSTQTTSWIFGKMGMKAAFSIQKIVFYFNGDTEVLERAGLLHIRPETNSDGNHKMWIATAVPSSLLFIVILIVCSCVNKSRRQRRNSQNQWGEGSSDGDPGSTSWICDKLRHFIRPQLTGLEKGKKKFREKRTPSDSSESEMNDDDEEDENANERCKTQVGSGGDGADEGSLSANNADASRTMAQVLATPPAAGTTDQGSGALRVQTDVRPAAGSSSRPSGSTPHNRNQPSSVRKLCNKKSTSGNQRGLRVASPIGNRRNGGFGLNVNRPQSGVFQLQSNDFRARGMKRDLPYGVHSVPNGLNHARNQVSSFDGRRNVLRSVENDGFRYPCHQIRGEARRNNDRDVKVFIGNIEKDFHAEDIFDRLTDLHVNIRGLYQRSHPHAKTKAYVNIVSAKDGKTLLQGGKKNNFTLMNNFLDSPHCNKYLFFNTKTSCIAKNNLSRGNLFIQRSFWTDDFSTVGLNDGEVSKM